MAGTIKLPSQLFGGPGNDILIGGGGPNVIVGGSGTTNMMGQGHADLLIGGRGRSTVTSQGANDLIIAGYTIFDTNPVALASILAEWASSQSYATRVGDLRGNNVVGLDLNGHNFLQANVTVFDNGQANTITPGTGLDLIFADVIPGNNDVLATIIGPLPQSDLVIDL